MKTPQFFYKHAGLGSLLATVANAAAIFLVFRLAYQHLGPSVVGTWALIQGFMVISRIGDGGSGGNITRLVAIDRGNQGGVKLRNFIATGLLVGTGPILILGLLILAPTFYYMEANYAHVVASGPLFGLVVCSLVFGLFSSTTGILSGCLDGLGLMALRGYLSCIANILFVVLGYIFVHSMGDLGLGISYVAYAVASSLILAFGIWLFRPVVGPDYQAHPIRELMWKTVNFNVNFLFMSLCQLLMDPVCKILIGRYSGLGFVAIFDLANKITSQARILYQAVLQSVLPLVSRENTDIEQSMHAKLLHWNKMVARWSLYTMSLIVLASGYLSLLSLGHINENFILDTLVLSIGSTFNTIGMVGYYAEVGSGHLRRLLTIFILMAISNIALGAVLGYFWGGVGVVIAFAATLSWTGIAMARPVFGNLLETLKRLSMYIAPEFALFATASTVTWLVMVRLQGMSTAMQTLAICFVALILLAVFLYREWDRVSRYYQRLRGSAATAISHIQTGDKQRPD